MRLVTYNLNSLTTRLARLLVLLDEHQPDIVCLQETKVTGDKFPHDELREAGYVAADHSAGRWAGVAVLAREWHGVREVTRGLPGEPDPSQARWVEATVAGIRVASVYVVNGRSVRHPEFQVKLGFLEALARRAAELAEQPAVIAGDLNVCPADIDAYDPAALHGGTHATPDERSRYSDLLAGGWTDAYRAVEPDEPGFTWWDYRAGHFHKGYGLRIDHVLVSPPLADAVVAARPDRSFRKPTKVPGTKPSDHAPVLVDLHVP